MPAGLKLLREFGNVDTSYDLTPEQLCEKVATSDALIIRSATQVPPVLLTRNESSTFCCSGGVHKTTGIVFSNDRRCMTASSVNTPRMLMQLRMSLICAGDQGCV